MTKERAAQLRKEATFRNPLNPAATNLASFLTECLDEIEKLQHDKQAATNAANRAIKRAQRGK